MQDGKYIYSIDGSRNSTYNMLRKTQVWHHTKTQLHYSES